MGIFDAQCSIFEVYHARLRFRDKVMGGTPKDPRIIESWLRSKAGIQQEEEIRQATYRTLLDLGADVTPSMSYAEMVEASESLAGSRQTNGFRKDETGLYLEGRTVKSMLKEACNILFAGERWGKTKKGPRSFLAERVFVDPDHIHLGVQEPSGVELFIGHTSGPRGPQSNLTYYEFVTGAVIEFTVKVAEDAELSPHWPDLWVLAQENGLGALRSQGHGRFDIESWDRLPSAARNGRATPTAVVV